MGSESDHGHELVHEVSWRLKWNIGKNINKFAYFQISKEIIISRISRVQSYLVSPACFHIYAWIYFYLMLLFYQFFYFSKPFSLILINDVYIFIIYLMDRLYPFLSRNYELFIYWRNFIYNSHTFEPINLSKGPLNEVLTLWRKEYLNQENWWIVRCVGCNQRNCS